MSNSKKKISSGRLHDEEQIDNYTSRLRTENGWIYKFTRLNGDVINSIFVPDKNEIK
jgi:hypothetical protein